MKRFPSWRGASEIHINLACLFWNRRGGVWLVCLDARYSRYLCACVPVCAIIVPSLSPLQEYKVSVVSLVVPFSQRQYKGLCARAKLMEPSIFNYPRPHHTINPHKWTYIEIVPRRSLLINSFSSGKKTLAIVSSSENSIKQVLAMRLQRKTR